MPRNTQPNPYAHLNLSDWWYPQDLSQEGNDQYVTLNESQVAEFRHDGFLVVEGLWSPELIQKASDEVRRLHPSKEVAKKTHSLSAMPWTQNGEKAPEESLNHMSVYPRALAAAAQLMETETINIRLSQSHVIAKHGLSSHAGGVLQIEGDQDIHVDYGNNTLLVPPERPRRRRWSASAITAMWKNLAVRRILPKRWQENSQPTNPRPSTLPIL